MGVVNRQSIRDEFDQTKSELKALARAGKVSQEVQVLINGLITIMELLIAIFMEKQTKKTSKNSSKPSSQTDKDESALGKQGAKGKGKEKANNQVANQRTIETTTVIRVDTCENCGQSLKDTPCQCRERRTRIDVIFQKTIEHFDAEVKQCPYCHAKTKAKHPKDLHSNLQYGPGIKAFVINLLIAQMVAVNRVQKMVKTMIGVTISEATLLKYVLRLHQCLEQWEQSTKEKLLASSFMHVDETSMRVDRKNHWIHVYSSGELTLKCLHRKRGKEAMQAINIIPRYGGVLIHDCWSSYLSYEHCDHGLCGSHLLRELAFIVESNGYRWATNMKRLLQEACREVTKSHDKCLGKKAYARLQRRYRNVLTRGEKELPALPHRRAGRRGKLAKSDAHNLWERLRDYESAVLLFAKRPDVAFTNNRAERDLRMSKVKQKVSGCFRQEAYGQAYCRISSYLQTMANKGTNPMVAVQMALSGEINN